MLILRRITSDGRFIPEIDGLRFVAISSVVAYHFYAYLSAKLHVSASGLLETALHRGSRGVPLFFAISGFILGRPFAMHYIHGAPKPNLCSYLLRRLTRLEPPYLVSLIAFFCLLGGRVAVPHLLASMAYIHNVVYGTLSPINPVAWSLEVEVQFYCLIPLIALIYKLPRSHRRAVLVALLFLGASRFLAFPERLHLSIIGWFQCFAAGLLLADLYVDGWDERPHWSFDLISLVLWPAVFLMGNMASWLLMPACVTMLGIAAFRSFAFRSFFKLAAISTVGGMCYTIYLIHYQVISLAGRLAHSPFSIAAASLFLLALASLAFFVLIERPCMDKSWPSLLKQRTLSALRYSAPSPLRE